MAPPVIVAGMHRSGTSFVAEVLAAAGLDLGDRLLAGDAGNRRGYFEDEEFVTLQRTMLARACPEGAVGWPDWGWTEAEHLDPSVLDTFDDAMAELVDRRRDRACWGWKDPRTTLLLDRWLAVAPDLLVVGVVRAPWQVAASVQRLPNELLRSSDVGVRIWCHYNERLLDFATRHPDRTVLAATDAFATRPETQVERIAGHLGLRCLHLEPRVGAEIASGRRRDAHPHQWGEPASFADHHPEAADLWHRISALAGS